MYRLGLSLTLKGGREAFTRLLLTVVAVAIGVTVLLGVFADFHAYIKTSGRPSWESTTGTPVTSKTPIGVKDALLWSYSENIYKGQFIEQLDIATPGSNAPVLPGVSKLPGPDQFYASPALAKLLQTVPKDELGNRFSGTQVGTIGRAALSFPTELAIYVGHTPDQLAKLPATIVVTKVATTAQFQGTTNIYKEAFGIGAIAVLFPILILISTASKLSASRREERYAAMRLIGATPHQINVVASIDAIVGSFIGTVLGILLFTLIRPAIANVSFSGVKFFANYVDPTIWGYLGILVVIPVIAAIASLVSLRRVQISPLGVSRKAAASKPGMWRLAPLVLGAPMFVAAALRISNNQNSGGSLPLILIGLLLTMVGLVLSGSWLTMQITRLLARFATSASSLLAARRLSDNPKAAFRSVSGLILAVFVGSFISVLIPAVNAAQSPTNENSLSNVLRVPYNTNSSGEGLPAQEGNALVGKLQSFSGTTVIPIYVNPAFLTFVNQNTVIVGVGSNAHKTLNSNAQAPDGGVVSCASLQQLSVLGACAPGVRAVTLSADNILGGDNPLLIYKNLPAVTGHSPSTSASLKQLQLAGLLVKANSSDTLEKVRTYLTTYNATVHKTGAGIFADDLSAWQMGVFEPETIGEVAAIRNNDDTNVGRVVLAIVALTLVTAGCSLTVTVGGSLVERKRPFTLLRVSGAPLSTLYKVVLLEAALPLVVVSLVAAGIGLGVAIPVVKSLMKSLAPKATYPVHPSEGYYIALGVGLVVSLGLVIVTLPLLKRITKPEEARFE